ncbi:MAG: hypothetical protein LBO72_06600 [Helicobacteraceae bacterium]|nr:hypothetical protein [Helicobacteraceae bacterium]
MRGDDIEGAGITADDVLRYRKNGDLGNESKLTARTQTRKVRLCDLYEGASILNLKDANIAIGAFETIYARKMFIAQNAIFAKRGAMKIKETLKDMRQLLAIHKRGADWTEKFGIAALAIGLFQAQTPLIGAISIILAAIAGMTSFLLTLKVERESK